MSDATSTLIIQVIVTLGGIVAAWFAMRAQTRKTSADREAQLDARFTSYIEIQAKDSAALKAEIADLRGEVDDLRRKLRAYQIGVDKLIRQLQRAGLTPAWLPPDNGHEPEPDK